MQHLVYLREIEVARQLKRLAEGRVDPEDLGFELEDDVVEIEVLRHTAMMPSHRTARKIEAPAAPIKRPALALAQKLGPAGDHCQQHLSRASRLHAALIPVE